MEQCDCGPPSGATGQSGGLPCIETSVSGSQTPHQFSNHSPEIILKTYSRHHVTTFM